MGRWLLLVMAASAEVAATLSLKAALERPWFYVVVVVGYVSAFGLLGLLLRMRMPLGVTYGIWSALGVAGTALLSALLFAEQLTPLMGLGLLLIIGGILCVELGSREPAPRDHEQRAL